MRKVLLISLLVVISFCIGIAYATTFSFTFDTATPAGSDDPAEADDRMREIKAAVQERGNVDHYWPLTGTEVSDADSGEHRKVLFHAPIASTPTVAADHGDLRIKDVNSKAELAWTDEDENELVLTSLGNNLANDSFLTATDNAGTGSVNLIKADINDIPEILVGAVLSADTAPAVDAGIANKKYVDDQVPDTNGACKAWAHVDTDGTLLAGFNATSARTALGKYTITWGTDFASANYVVTTSSRRASAVFAVCNVATQLAGSITIEVGDQGTGFLDRVFSVATFGLQ